MAIFSELPLKALFFSALAAIVPLSSLGNFSQRDAQVQTNTVSLEGSDRSMELATGSAMSALLSLSARNIPAALGNGYRAYGEYIDAETLDHRAGEAARKAGALSSLGTKSATIPGSDRSAEKTSFRRLKTDFLYRGETAQISQRFEAASGMKREDFLQFLANASETKISPDDPQLMKKSLAMLQGFISQIPNEEFRSNLQGTLDSVPESVKSGVLASAISKAVKMIAQSSPTSQASEQAVSNLSKVGSSPEEKISEQFAKSEAEDPLLQRLPAGAQDSDLKEAKPMLYASELHQGQASELNNYFGADARNRDEQSIFSLVSNCYRRSGIFKNQL